MPANNSEAAFWNVPNILSLSRIPLAAVLFFCIDRSFWTLGFVVFLTAAFTDWLDGWWARRFHQISAAGRAIDPLTDKILIIGAFIFFLPIPAAGIAPWVVTIVVVRELFITGLRGIVEKSGHSFGADWFGKLKTVLQCVFIGGILLIQILRENHAELFSFELLVTVQLVLFYMMLAATLGSGLQYSIKAFRLLR